MNGGAEELQRIGMVAAQLAARDIRDERVMAALRKVPRHLFVPEAMRGCAYEDRPLSIGLGQTISQPYMVACMSQALALQGGEKVLEIGTGSGYQTAVLLELGAQVFSMERLPRLAEYARENLRLAGYGEGLCRVGDGTLGWPEQAPFDRVIVTAGAPSIPVTLLDQVDGEGFMIIPVGDEERQQLLLVRRERGVVTRTRICSCAFVKLVGREGW